MSAAAENRNQISMVLSNRLPGVGMFGLSRSKEWRSTSSAVQNIDVV